MPIIDNIYALIATIFVCMVFSMLIVFAIRKRVSFKLSSDGVVLNTPDGKYISSERNFFIFQEIRKLDKVIYDISEIQILDEQMTFIERELERYYKENLDLIVNKAELSIDSDLYRNYQLIYILHEEKMKKQIKRILKENHLCDKPEWNAYKERQFEFTWSKSMEYLDSYFGVIQIESRKIITDQIRAYLKNEYKVKFHYWMDEFRNITSEKLKEVQKTQNKIETLHSQLGYNHIIEVKNNE
ncbi:MAG: hypothetical protein A2015_02265 [Spirochaetes bacterium GWF1_31_7]|nr:MAG: hypothetical protein A2Y30_06115 [Spirochaetes bacterium GWE1_32_154]OHD50740.1 MAG: hypothetical protein A2015_02265 [Spirochaetes bacterium GWF1_31_7]OHD81466.1 MAG: hypothetical protein A2355_11250 [Spirochaetes bacterium RIFOXYB1_FULL_32_8]HBD95077.1 hypothetical protein [Spirochaetia bacterium]HBI38037.1 hypothetical protein [Spirochaetia bacterium]